MKRTGWIGLGSLALLACILPVLAGAANPPDPAPGSPLAAPEGPYVVKKGDTLWGISRDLLQDPLLWPRLWETNSFITNPNLIYPGDQLVLPGKDLTPAPPVAEAPKPAPPAQTVEAPQPPPPAHTTATAASRSHAATRTRRGRAGPRTLRATGQPLCHGLQPSARAGAKGGQRGNRDSREECRGSRHDLHGGSRRRRVG